MGATICLRSKYFNILTYCSFWNIAHPGHYSSIFRLFMFAKKIAGEENCMHYSYHSDHTYLRTVVPRYNEHFREFSDSLYRGSTLLIHTSKMTIIEHNPNVNGRNNSGC